jgi:alkylation response protein AidB-like acyl-CoA dehydrogenase
VNHRLAGLRTELETARWLAYRVPWLQERGEPAGTAASIAKLYGSELVQRIARAATDVLGPPGGLLPGSQRAELDGLAAFRYLDTLSATIGAGTSEIQRMLIATRGLGLPR